MSNLQSEGELSLVKNETILVLDQDGANGWWKGERNGKLMLSLLQLLGLTTKINASDVTATVITSIPTPKHTPPLMLLPITLLLLP